MKPFLLIFGVFLALPVIAEEPSVLCQDAMFITDFNGYNNNLYKDWTKQEIREAFYPFLYCLQRWTLDGGKADGLEIPPYTGGYRFVVSMRAAEIVDALILARALERERRTLIEWVVSSIHGWHDQVQRNGWKILVDLKAKEEGLPVLREAARTFKDPTGKQLAWDHLALLVPEKAAEELEPLVETDKDYEFLAKALVKVEHPSVVPALRRCAVRLPDWQDIQKHILHLERREPISTDSPLFEDQ